MPMPGHGHGHGHGLTGMGIGMGSRAHGLTGTRACPMPPYDTALHMAFKYNFVFNS